MMLPLLGLLTKSNYPAQVFFYIPSNNWSGTIFKDLY